MFGTSSKKIKEVISLSLPMAGSRFTQMLSGFIGMIMVAHLGKQYLAAGALINAMLSAVLLVFLVIIFAVSFVTGQTIGAKKEGELGALVQQGLVLSALLGLCMLVLFWYAGDILILFHQKPSLVVYVERYFHALMWGAVPLMLQCCMQQFLYGVLKQRIVIILNTASLILGIPVAYVLIFGKFGFPLLGISGLAYTFSLQATFGFIAIIFVCLLHPELKKYRLFSKQSHQDFYYFKKIFAVGWPMSIQFGGEMLAFFIVSIMIGWLGVNALAAVQVTQQWLFLVVVPVFAMSEAAGILVGHAFGAKNYHELREIGQASLLVSLSFVFILAIVFLLFPHYLASLYLNTKNMHNASLMHVIRILFLILPVTLVLNACRDVVSGLLRGVYDTRFPMRIGLLVMWLLVVPLGYLIAFPLRLGVVGFRLGGCIGLLVGAVIVYRRWVSRTDEFLQNSHSLNNLSSG